MTDLKYDLHEKRDEAIIRVEAVPNGFAANPHGEFQFARRWDPIDKPFVPFTVVNWSCGGMTFDSAAARKFFEAGLAVCDRLDELAREHAASEKGGS